MIDPNKPKSVLSRPNEGQDFDIVERTIKENKSFNENLIFNLVRNNEIIACVDFSDLIIELLLPEKATKFHTLLTKIPQ